MAIPPVGPHTAPSTRPPTPIGEATKLVGVGSFGTPCRPRRIMGRLVGSFRAPRTPSQATTGARKNSGGGGRELVTASRSPWPAAAGAREKLLSEAHITAQGAVRAIPAWPGDRGLRVSEMDASAGIGSQQLPVNAQKLRLVMGKMGGDMAQLVSSSRRTKTSGRLLDRLAEHQQVGLSPRGARISVGPRNGGAFRAEESAPSWWLRSSASRKGQRSASAEEAHEGRGRSERKKDRPAAVRRAVMNFPPPGRWPPSRPSRHAGIGVPLARSSKERFEE